MFVVSVDRQIRVHLISGSVVVHLPGAAANSAIPIQQLREGQQIVYHPDKAALAQAPSQAKPSDEQWVTGMKTFDGQSVQDVIDEVNRYTDRKIVIRDADLASRKVFLDVHLRDAAESARDLADYLGVAVDTSDPSKLALYKIK
jgi:transmembrane sensor